MPSDAPAQPQIWDIWCRVVDNHGDLGVCWRLARELAARGGPRVRVRLYIDDASALGWMAPAGVTAESAEPAEPAEPGAAVLPWPAVGPWPDAGDVVIEAFGCDPPPAVVAAMSRRTRPPIWLNLEYLSAEPYVERSHRLPSPQPGGLTKWFFYPGFTPRTGGLLREAGLLAQRAAFDGNAWLAQQGWARQPGERVVSLFCYDNPALPALLRRLAEQPTLLLATPGPAQRALDATCLDAARPPGTLPATLRVLALPWLTQPDYDRLLWACDLNFVRGEDSLVRALWAGAPFVWHIYPQHDGAHAAKLQALLQQMQAPADVAAWVGSWNGLGPKQGVLPAWPANPGWRQACQAWQNRLAAQDDLATQLLAFVSSQSR